MVIAHELGMSVRRFFQEVDQDELGWWIAYFQVKHKREERELERARRKRGGGAGSRSRTGKFPTGD